MMGPLLPLSGRDPYIAVLIVLGVAFFVVGPGEDGPAWEMLIGYMVGASLGWICARLAEREDGQGTDAP